MATSTIAKIDPISIVIEGPKSTVSIIDKTTGAKSKKSIYTKDLFDIIAQLVEVTKERSGVIHIPYGSDYSVVKYWEETQNGFLVLVCEASPSIRTFQMEGFNSIVDYEMAENGLKDYPLPTSRYRLVTKIHWPYTFMFTAFQKSSNKWTPRDGHIAWGDEPMKDTKTPIYGMPLSNTYGCRRGDRVSPPFRICWGEVEAFAHCTPETAASLIPIFYSSIFNCDLVDTTFFKNLLPLYSHDLIVKNPALFNGRLTQAYLKTIPSSMGMMVTNSTIGDALTHLKSGRN